MTKFLVSRTRNFRRRKRESAPSDVSYLGGILSLFYRKETERICSIKERIACFDLRGIGDK